MIIKEMSSVSRFILLVVGLLSISAVHAYIPLLTGNFPTNAFNAAAVATSNGEIYLQGGNLIGSASRVTDNRLYTDPLGAPTLKVGMPFARGEGCAVIVDDARIYYIGGTASSTGLVGTFLRYQISYDLWFQDATLATPRRLAACVFDSTRREILTFFGTGLGTEGNTAAFSAERFHPDNFTLNSAPSWTGAPPNHGIGASAVYDPATDRTYIMGGEAAPTALSILSQTTGWTSGAALPAASSSGSVALIAGEIWYFAAGTLQIYSPSNNTWRMDSFSISLGASRSNVAPVSPPNVHLFGTAHNIMPCAVPCPAPASPCVVSVCDYFTGTCSEGPGNNGKNCSYDGCTGADCVCTNGQCLPDVPNADILPLFECFRSGRELGYRAYLSWQNFESAGVAILKDSPRNRFTGLDGVPLGQPDFFPSGRSRAFPLNRFSLPWNGSEVIWRLSGYELTIDIAPSMICPRNLTLLFSLRGDLLTLDDLLLVRDGLARLLGVSDTRLRLNLITNAKRQTDGQTLELEIEEAGTGVTEPSPEEAVIGFIENSSNATGDALSVNGKVVEVTGVTTKPPDNTRPGVPIGGPQSTQPGMQPNTQNGPDGTAAPLTNPAVSGASMTRVTLLAVWLTFCSLLRHLI